MKEIINILNHCKILSDNIDDFVFILDRHYRVWWSNSCARKFFTLYDVNNNPRKCHDILFENDKRCEYCPVKISQESGNTFYSERSNRNSYVFREKAVPIPDKDLTLLIVRDITGRKHAENFLRNSEKRLSLAMQALKAGVWEFDPESETVVHYDHRFYEMLGYEPYEFPPDMKIFLQMIHPDDYPLVEKAVIDLIDGVSNIIDIKYRVRNKSGSYQLIHGYGTLITLDSGKRHVVGLHIDLSGVKEDEDG
ncbi:MAG: PAS domain-containing protein [Candidatus Muiribacteriaceae bacterium]